ncbi:ribonuclease 2-like isoform X1 [Benincasa hispida]|uniref:ribonuclease 2-like isoform X1 n=1 Tax=Benincasa hispida TaxID=102211 RepID=UPI0018FFBD81|nr:ribonuclease 2-like isoform X1 [Benincasa hispida]
MGSFSLKAAAHVVFVVVLGIVLPLQTAEGFTGGKEQREFDYFVLALQWPAALCRNITVCCPTNACCRGADSPTEFTIHGLWPQYEGKGWPSCCTNETFNENEISSLFEDLDKYWPSYRCGLVGSCDSRKGSFWAHQYEKHGTCGTPVILQEYDYFLTTLTLFFKYNVTKALENAEIIASDIKKYPIQDVVNAVHLAFKANPKLACAKRGIIKEIYLCFDKQFKLRDCDATKSCPKAVKLPEFHDPQELDMVKRSIPRVIDVEAII